MEEEGFCMIHSYNWGPQRDECPYCEETKEEKPICTEEQCNKRTAWVQDGKCKNFICVFVQRKKLRKRNLLL
jgi:hypothetical protein